MGYYSDFEIRLEGVKDDVEGKNYLNGVAELLHGISGGYSFSTYGDGVLHSDDRYKWYDHERDLGEVSTFYPDDVFEMRAIGEDGERWVVFAKNGQVYSEYLTPSWPKFDESKFT